MSDTTITAAVARPKRRRHTLIHVVLIALSLAWLLPIVMALGFSLMPADAPGTTAYGLLPQHPSLSNYVNIWTDNPITQNLINSVIITVPSVLMVVLFGSMMAFALMRYRFFGKGIVVALMLLTMVLPLASIVVSLFRILLELGLYNSRLGVAAAYSALGLPFAVLVFRNAFDAIPDPVLQAARIDGASEWQTYRRVCLPLIRPAIAVVVVWQSMMSWNDFLLPLVAIEDNDRKPLTLVPMAYRGIFLSQPGALFAILVLISVPMVIVFLAVQRHLVEGLSGAIK